ncbi:MAG: ferritin-like domain-containing protein [Actinomycetota bacterium]|nr:ferritin-like domain-containing protein [Actinomycetota bacterium]
MTTCPDAVTVIADLLRDEHAAVYAYGVLGARLSDADRRLARTAFDAHRAVRDSLRARVLAAGQDPPGPAAAYDVTVAGPAAALALAVRVEEQLAVRWRDLVALSAAADVRQLAVRELQAAAVRAALWRRASGTVPTVAFPGRA